jgi:hypothetical protein
MNAKYFHLTHFLPRLASNCDLPDFCLSRSWDFSCESLHPTQEVTSLKCKRLGCLLQDPTGFPLPPTAAVRREPEGTAQARELGAWRTASKVQAKGVHRRQMGGEGVILERQTSRPPVEPLGSKIRYILTLNLEKYKEAPKPFRVSFALD